MAVRGKKAKTFAVMNVFVMYAYLMALAGVLEWAGHKESHAAAHGFQQCLCIAGVTFCLGMVASSKDRRIAGYGRVLGMVLMAAVGILYSYLSVQDVFLPADQVVVSRLVGSTLVLVLSSAAGFLILYNNWFTKPKLSQD